MLRVALVILQADPSRGGAERYTLDLATALSALGHEVDLLSATAPPTPDRAWRHVPLSADGRTRSRRYRHFTRQLAEYLAANGYDIVHAMLPVPPGLCDVYHPHAGIAAERSGLLSWWTNPRRRLFAKIERDLLISGRPPITVTLSQYVEDTLRRHYPTLPSHQTRRLFNGVDLDRFQPDGPRLDRRELGAVDGDLVGLFVGNDFGRKGLDLAVTSLLPHGPKRFRLVVAGRDDPKSYRRLAQRHGIEHRLHFLGPRSDLPTLYRSADLFVQLSHHDPCSLATLEALATGLPVLGSRFDGATEVMTPGVHGYIAQNLAPDDSDAVQGLMQMDDNDTRRAMHEACIALRPSLSWEHHVAKLTGIYEEIVGRNKTQQT